MPRLTPYAAHEIAMVSSTPTGSGLPIGLMPGALPSDHASRQTLNTTAMRLPFGHSQSGSFFIHGSGRKTRSDPVLDHRKVRRVEPARCRSGMLGARTHEPGPGGPPEC